MDTTYSDYTLLEQIPGSNNTSGKLQPYLESIYKAGLVMIVIGAILMISFGGFIYMASAGNTSMLKKGKGMITDAIIGLAVALSIWLILNIINPDLVNLSIDPLPGISFDPGGVGADTAGQNDGGDNQENGSCSPIPDSQLTSFPAGATDGRDRKGTADTVKRFMDMRAAASKAGVNLLAGSAYRPPSEGEELWKSHGCRRVNGKTVCSGSVVAVPCSLGGRGSNHTKGTAIDIQTNADGTAWLRRNAANYGFYNKIASEPWHWSDTGH
jgi:hypothetical protein